MVIGIAGKAGAGKDTVAKMIARHLPEAEFEIVRFADKVKDIVCLLTGCTRKDLENQEFKESQLPVEWTDDFGTISYRQAMQYIGTDLFRNKFHKDTWVNATMKDINPELYNYIIPDVRFKNEADAIRNIGGTIIYVESNTFSSYDHESEIGLEGYNFDIIIHNNSSLEALDKAVGELVTYIIDNTENDDSTNYTDLIDSKKEIEQIKSILNTLLDRVGQLEKINYNNYV